MHVGLRMSTGRMVGRDGELGRLLTLLDDAEAGRSVAALVSGDAGVGKTRPDRRGHPAGGRTGLHRAVRPVRRAGRQRALPAAGRRAARRRPSPPGSADALSSRPALAGCSPRAATGRASPTRTARAWPGSRCSAACSACSPSCAAAAPVLLVLEDLHWADASTRDLVTFLSRMLHRERVALIGSYRTDDLHRRHPLRPVVAELLRLPSVTTVDLAPLAALRPGRAPHRGRGRPHRRDRAERHRRPGPTATPTTPRNCSPPRSAASHGGDPAERHPAGGPGGAAAQPGRAAVRHDPAGAPRGGRGRPQGRRRAGPGRVGPGARPTTRPPCGRRSPISCSCRTAPRATSSGTPCCARPSTATCCRGSGPGCTPR